MDREYHKPCQAGDLGQNIFSFFSSFFFTATGFIVSLSTSEPLEASHGEQLRFRD
jgi:hypothetical protein